MQVVGNEPVIRSRRKSLKQIAVIRPFLASVEALSHVVNSLLSDLGRWPGLVWAGTYSSTLVAVSASIAPDA